MRINKVASSNSEKELFKILNKKSIVKNAVLGYIRPILSILGRSAKYGAGGYAAGYAIDQAQEYFSGELAEQDLDDILFSDNDIGRAYHFLIQSKDNMDGVAAFIDLVSNPQEESDVPNDEESTGNSDSVLDNIMRKQYSAKRYNFNKYASTYSDRLNKSMNSIVRADLIDCIAEFRQAERENEAAKAQADSALGMTGTAKQMLSSGYASALNVSQGFGLDFLDDAPGPESGGKSKEEIRNDLIEASRNYSNAYEIVIKSLTICIDSCKEIIKIFSENKRNIESFKDGRAQNLQSMAKASEKLLSDSNNFIAVVDKKLSSFHKKSLKKVEMSKLVSRHTKNYLIPKSIRFVDKRFDPKYEKMVFDNLGLRTSSKKFLSIDSLNIEMPKIQSGEAWINAFNDDVKKHINEFVQKEILFIKDLKFFKRFSDLENTSKEQDEFYVYLSKAGFVKSMVRSYRKVIFKIENSGKSGFQRIKSQISEARSNYKKRFGSDNFMTTAHNYKYFVALLFDFLNLSNDIGSEGMSQKIKDSFTLALEKYLSERYIPRNKRLQNVRKNLYNRYQKLDRRGDKVEEKYRDYGSFAKDMEVSAKNQQNNLEKHSHSINKNKSIVKNSNFLDQYYKDAISGLSNPDPLLKEFYQSMRQETLRNSELRDARKNLRSSEEQEGQDIVNQAHPKEIRLSDAHGDGGLLENGNEQKERSLQVAKKNPTGNFK